MIIATVGIWPTGSSASAGASRPPPTGGGRPSSWPTSISSPPARTTWPPSSPLRPSRTSGPWPWRSSSTWSTPRSSCWWREPRVLSASGPGWPSAWSWSSSVSFAYSVVDTHGNPVDAYFSPFTRAWELALGALVAVCTPWLLKVPARAAALATWVGLGAILIAASAFTSQTAYPGSLVAIPVVGAALIIAGGMKAHAIGAEALLHLAPFRWLGRLLLLALSVALAHPDHRRRVRGQDEPVGQGQPGLGPGGPGGVDGHLLARREPHPALPWLSGAPAGRASASGSGSSR